MTGDSARLKILVIDDEPMILRLLGRLLSRTHDVTTEDRGESGLARAQAETFDLVLCDVMLPDLNGIAIHKTLTTTHPDTAARLVFLTGGVFTGEATTYLASVPNETLSKPFTFDKIRELLATITPR